MMSIPSSATKTAQGASSPRSTLGSSVGSKDGQVSGAAAICDVVVSSQGSCALVVVGSTGIWV